MTGPVFLGNHEPGSDEWHEVRRWRLGGSEVAAVLGLSPWQSRFGLWMQKKGYTEPQADNPLLEWGRRIEPVIREKFVEDHPGDWQRSPGMFHAADRSWQIANPDAMDSGCVLEVKTALYPDGWGPDGSDDIPIYYRAQLLWYLDALGRDTGWLSVLIGGTDYRVYRLDRGNDDVEADIAALRSEGERFVADLMNDRQPDIDRHAATYQVLRQLHPEIQPGRLEVDPDLAGDYLAAIVAESEAKTDRDFYASQILAELGSTKDAYVDGIRFAYRTSRSRNGQPGTPFLAVDRTRLAQITHPRTTIREAVSA